MAVTGNKLAWRRRDVAAVAALFVGVVASVIAALLLAPRVLPVTSVRLALVIAFGLALAALIQVARGARGGPRASVLAASASAGETLAPAHPVSDRDARRPSPKPAHRQERAATPEQALAAAPAETAPARATDAEVATAATARAEATREAEQALDSIRERKERLARIRAEAEQTLSEIDSRVDESASVTGLEAVAKEEPPAEPEPEPAAPPASAVPTAAGGDIERAIAAMRTQIDAMRTELQTMRTEVERALAAAATAVPAPAAPPPESVEAASADVPTRRPRPQKQGGEQPAPGDGRGETCEIRWWHGARRGGFEARATTPEGRGYLAGRSPMVRWESSEPPERTGSIAAAHESLVAKLSREGWEPEGAADTWYGGRFRRRAEASEPGEGADPQATPRKRR